MKVLRVLCPNLTDALLSFVCCLFLSGERLLGSGTKTPQTHTPERRKPLIPFLSFTCVFIKGFRFSSVCGSLGCVAVSRALRGAIRWIETPRERHTIRNARKLQLALNGCLVSRRERLKGADHETLKARGPGLAG